MKKRLYISVLFLLLGMTLSAQYESRCRIAADPRPLQSMGVSVEETVLPLTVSHPNRAPQDGEGFNTEGTDFWLTFMQNYEYNVNSRALKMQIVFSSRYAANITVSNPNTGWSTQTSVKANGVTIIAVPTAQCYNYGSDQTQNTGLYIQASAPISVYGANFGDYTFDATNVVPTPSLGTDYVVQAYRTQREGSTEFAIVATEDDTHITMVLAGPTLTRKQGTYTLTLNRGQVYQATSEAEKGTLAGTVIKADKKIAVFNGDIDLYIPDYNGYSDHIVEQAMPVQTWGKKFVLTKSYGQTSDYVMFTAVKDGTQIRKDGTVLATINTCQSYMYRLTDAAVYIETSEPAACYLYQSSRTANSSRQGDPSMVWITPQEQGIKQITFATFKTQVTHYHYMNVVVPTSAVGSMTYDGSKLTGFKTVPGNAEYSYLTKKIDHGTHTLYNADAEFVAHVYGMGVDESYAYCVGGYLREINQTDIDDIIEQVTIEQTYHICEGQSVTIAGKQYSEPVMFLDTVGNQIKKYTVVLHTSFLDVDTIAFRQGTTLNWHGQAITKPGTYRDEKVSKFGCDSVYKVFAKYDNVTVTYDTVCASAFYKFRGESFSLPAYDTYPQDYTVKKIEGDWEYHMQLRILPQVEYFTDTYQLEPEEVYDYHGMSISRAGTYQVNLENRFGCDSIVTLTVTQPVNSRIYYTICEGEKYNFFGDILTQGNTYTKTVVGTDGIEKVHQLILTVEQAYTPVIYATICEGESYDLNGFHESQAGTYRQYLRSVNGCDSTVTLKLDICQPQSRTIEDVICSGTTYDKYGFSETRAGTYVRALRNQYGCDSTVTLVLREAQSYRFEENIKLVDEETRLWHGQTLDKKGTYTAPYSTVDGCDSIYIAHVRKVVGLEEEVYDTLCYATTYEYRGHTYDIPVPVSYPYDFVMEVRDLQECKRYRMILTLMGADTTRLSYTLSPNESITLGEQTISEEGIYTEKFTSRFNCDSVVVLTVSQPVIEWQELTADICSGEVYLFAGQELTRPATYIDSVKVEGKNGWRITKLTLNVHQNYTFVTDTVIQQGQTYQDEHFTESQSGDYTVEGYSVWGCDSTYILNLSVCAPKKVELFETINEGEVYNRNGFLAYTKDDYSRTDLTIDGCDSITILHLNVLPALEPIYTDSTFCAGSTCLWRGGEYFERGTYTAETTLPDGRKQLYVLRLKEQSVYHDTVYASICKGETYMQYNFNHSLPNTYTQHLVTQAGCDSTMTLVLTVNDTSSTDIYESICEGETYSKYGITTTTGGDYVRRYETINGCDSILNIHISVNEPTSFVKKVTINQGQTYPWKGVDYRETTYLVDTLLNAAGCDSVVIFDLFVNPLITENHYIEFCEGDSVTLWGDTIVKTEGFYMRSFRTEAEADSLVTYVITVLEHTDSVTTAVIQDGEIFPWHGKEYTQSVHLTDTIPNAVGCDSICTLDLTVVGYIYQDSARVCENDLADFEWQGEHFTKDRLETTKEIRPDSVVHFRVILLPLTYGREEKTIPSTQLPYTWYGLTFDKADEKPLTLQGANSCDSIVTLHLNVEPQGEEHECEPLVAEASVSAVCANDRQIRIALNIQQGQARNYSVHFDVVAQAEGLTDGAAVLSQDGSYLTVSLPPLVDTTNYPKPNTYAMTLSAQDTCDNTWTQSLTLDVLYPSWIMVQRWNDVIALYNDRYNGGYRFSSIRWYNEGTPVSGKGVNNSYIYTGDVAGRMLNFGTRYWAALVREGETTEICTCPFIPQHTDNVSTRFEPLVQISARNRGRELTIESETCGTYHIYDVCGRHLGMGRFGDSGSGDNRITLPGYYAAGTYILLFMADDGTSEIHKNVVW